MAINIDNNKLSLFHTFSKTPVSSNITLGNAINKAGHTVTGAEVWTDDIPYFGTMSGTDGAHSLLSKDSKWGDMFKCAGDNGNEYYKRNNTAWTEDASFASLWENVTEDFVDGYVLTNSKGKGVIVYHKDKYITNLNGDNNANTDSENCAARLWSNLDKEGKEIADNGTRLVEQFIGPTDKALNGMASVDYAPIIMKKGVTTALKEGTDYSMLTVSGTILWSKDTANDGETYSISCFEYIGDKVSDTLATLKEELGEIETAAGAGITVSDGKASVTGTKVLEVVGSGAATVSVAEGTGKTTVTVGVDTSNLATKEDVNNAKVTLSSNKTTANKGITIDNDGQESKTFTIGIDQNVIATKSSVDTLAGKVTTAEGNITGLTTRMGTAEGNINTITGDITSIKGRIDSLESLPEFRVEVVATAPAPENATENTIYLVENANATGTYIEYLAYKKDGVLAVEQIGSTAVSLAGYAKSVKINTDTSVAADSTTGVIDLSNYKWFSGFYNTVSNGSAGTVPNESSVKLSKSSDNNIWGIGVIDATDTAKGLVTLSSTVDASNTGAVTGAGVASAISGLASDAEVVKTVKMNGSETPLTPTDGQIDLGNVVTGLQAGSTMSGSWQTGEYTDAVKGTIEDSKIQLYTKTASSTQQGVSYLYNKTADTIGTSTVAAVTEATVKSVADAKVDKSDATYVKKVKMNGAYKTTAGNEVDLGDVIVGVDNTGLDGKGIQLSVTNDKKIQVSVDAASATVPGLVKLSQSITDGVTDATVSSDALFDKFKTVQDAIDNKNVGVTSINGASGAITIEAGGNGNKTTANSGGDDESNLWGLNVHKEGPTTTIIDGFIGLDTENGATNNSVSLYANTASLPTDAKKVIGNFVYDGNGRVIDTIRAERMVSGFSGNTGLYEWVADMPNLKTSVYDGKGCFANMKGLTTFIGDLSSLEDGTDMFYLCNALTTFIGDLSSLSTGGRMFDGNLNAESVECILETIPTYTSGSHFLSLKIHVDAVATFNEITGAQLPATKGSTLYNVSYKGWTITGIVSNAD